jgi:hypothetical protein
LLLVLSDLVWSPERSQRERTRQEGRRSKFYEVSDNLIFRGAIHRLRGGCVLITDGLDGARARHVHSGIERSHLQTGIAPNVPEASM